ncbi:EAL domain-containing protein [Actimicrobium sp. CCC2.4]|uniref:bifunctional diguanylate cyclase/phosphodiesterase n=1 Tax=Actimicrobium sp. CCC2.4 TaxID=3048606 RepID=UPI002AC92137|nr:EAL domain-containing protein [Actimicrobium sp. CCC2.4]MEB0137353.1 EAL domain-containing protein [Actimicrobium sp. CCC2.4]WPX33386.1 EAL domain-containing protein [Actimicrobium sp. CCC2.4]
MTHPDHSISAELEQSCAQEPIHLLGTVQPHGFVMVVDLVSARIVQVSSGITRHWPGLPDAAAMLDTALTDWVDGTGSDALADLPTSNPQILPWQPRMAKVIRQRNRATDCEWECLGHRSGDTIILEWLPLDNNVEERLRQTRLFADITNTMSQLRQAHGLTAFCQECVESVQQLSLFDRVMIYRFLPDDSGEVIAEHTAGGHEKRYLGLRFPASDIPSQARRLYLTNTLRILVDVDAEADTLLPATRPLDQSHGLLRSLSPVHLCYLRNMRVCATMTLSIIVDGKLWGLITCHHHAPKVPPYQVRDGLRQICELVAEVASIRIAALCELEDVARRHSIDELLTSLQQHLILVGDMPQVLAARLPQLLAAFGASGLSVRIDDVMYVGGTDRQLGSAEQVLDEIAGHTGPDAGATNDAVTIRHWDRLPCASLPRLTTLPDAAGLMLARRAGMPQVFCCLVRQEQVQQVRWAGEPEKNTVVLPDGRLRLEPRRSFAEWQQSVGGRSQAWTGIEALALEKLLCLLCDVRQSQANDVLHRKLQWRAHHDPLTGLFNRRAMEDEVTGWLKNGKFNSALILLDIDHFKRINDNYGHVAGDRILQELSARLESAVRDFDLLARLGGDEFMLLMRLPQADPALVLSVAERLHEAVAPPFLLNGQPLTLGISVGIAIPPLHGQTVGDLLRRADLALYQAKAAGRSRSVVYDPAMEADQADSYQLESDLMRAIENNELSLVFQPKVDLASFRVAGMEALLRWDHPVRGPISPAVFIPIAERSGQIVHIDRWVMRHAIATQARWRSQGHADLPVAINLSMQDIASADLVRHLNGLLDEFLIPPALLEIEITESSLMRELDHTRHVLHQLHANGIRMSMDDFGTGYSSLSYLRKLPLQCLKIDQSFTRSMLDDSHAEKLTQAILAMGLALKMEVLAEGIETLDQMTWLKNHGCQIGQGNLFSRPVRADVLHQVIEEIERRFFNVTVSPESPALAG